MSERQFTTPLVIENGEAVSLDRIPFGEKSYNESWLQGLLWDHPSLLPVAEIEPIFEVPLPIAREVQTACTEGVEAEVSRRPSQVSAWSYTARRGQCDCKKVGS